MTRTGRLLLAAALLAPAPATARPRVVILGFDGADANLTAALLEQGKLPNLARLRDRGAFAPLATTNPPQTPVSWSTFATGLNPGRTTIFDFLKREAGSYIPTFALNEESSRPFLAGERNPLLGAAAGGLLGLLLVALPLRLLRRPRAALAAGAGAALLLGALGHHALGRYLPERVPTAINNRRGTTFWELAAARGLHARIVRVPATFPAAPLPGGEFLSGLGVPDVRGTVGTFSFYTTEKLARAADTEFGGKVVELDRFERETATVVHGPRNKLFYAPDPRTHLDPEGDPREIDLPLLIRRTAGGVELEVSGSRITLAPGQWSGWTEFTFPFNPIVRLRGIGRFHLVASEPELKLYLSPINLHPKGPPVPISSPGGFAWELKQRLGWYKTLGWAEDTWSYTEGRVSEEVFLQDVEHTVASEEQFLQALLAERAVDLYVQVFSFTDRVAHVFWRLTDPEHPAYDAALAARWGGVIDEWYGRMDAIVGKAMAAVADDPETLLLVVSDHGFATWRRSVNYNTWLVKNGYMTLFQSLGGRQLTLEDLFGNKKFWPYVDWSRTRAYSLGLGNIYVNLRGREPQGVVEPGPEYEQLLAALREGLEGLVDPATGARPVRRVYRREEIYRGFDPELIPDLRVANAPGYRVSWQSSLGATPAEVFEDNAKPWSADHCSLDPEAVPGILFSNRPLRRPLPGIVDVMPTVLGFLGIEPPRDLDGTSFL